MIYSKDYVIDLINEAFGSLARILGNKGIKSYEKLDVEEDKTGEGLLYHKLKKLVDEGRICEAENMLFDALEGHTTPLCLKAARMFYMDINELSDERLEECNFSRREILDGLWDAEHIFMSKEEAVG